MSSIRKSAISGRLLGVGLTWIAVATLAQATTAQAGSQLFSGSWVVKAFGNERVGGSNYFYFAVGIPGVQCNPNLPRCPFSSTPTDGQGYFDPFGGGLGPGYDVNCVPWYDFGGMGTAARPAKGQTPTTGGRPKRRIPPLYRNPAFFSALGAPNHTYCTAGSTQVTPGGKGFVAAGVPVTGPIRASNTASTTNGGLVFGAAAANSGSGIRATGRAGERSPYDWYNYTYSYATLRNDAGFFAAGDGPGSFNLQKFAGTRKVASIRVKQGAAKFGGTMRMLGAITSKRCYYIHGGCSLGSANWYFDLIGATAYTSMGVVTKGYQRKGAVVYFNTGLGQTTTAFVEASRFPWTTGSVTVTAAGLRHASVHYAHGYDNRGPVVPQYPSDRQDGTLQVVSPVLTRWLRIGFSYQTAGIGILRFVPEAHGWMMLAAGASLIGVGYRLRGKRSASRAGR